MRKIDILNKNYEVANLNTVVYEGYSIKQIIEDSPVFDVTPPQHYLDYWQKIYDYLKDGTQLPGHTYIPSGQSKYDIAYVNKTIDDPIAELNGHTLREVFEDGNLIASINGGSSFDITTDTEDLLVLTAKIITNPAVGVITLKRNLNYQEKIYSKIAIKGTSVNPPFTLAYQYDGLTSGTNTTVILSTASNDTYYKASSVISIPNDFLGDSVIKAYISDTTNIQIGDTLTIDKTYGWLSISLTEFGILESTDMNYYYSLYLNRKNITKKYLTYADIFEDLNHVINFTFKDANADSLADGWGFVQSDGNTTKSITNGYQNYTNPNNLGYSGALKSPVFNHTPDNNDKYFIRFESENVVAFALKAEFIRENGVQVSNIDYNLSVKSYLGNTFGSSITNNFMAFYPRTGYTSRVRNAVVINSKYLDEFFTKTILETLLTHYLLVKDIVIYPENFIPLEPTGFGNRYIFNELNKKVYGHELNFENMSINLLFGLYRNAYDSFNLLMNFMIDNEAIISYNYGKGERYTDVRLINAPKTELEPGNIMRNKFEFKRITPFYTLIYGNYSIIVQNNHDWDLKPVVEGTISTNLVYIEMEDQITGLVTDVKFDFTVVSKPFTFKYNCETKEILINGTNSGYAFIDQSYGVSFLSIPKGNEHFVSTIGITNPKITIKKWVID